MEVQLAVIFCGKNVKCTGCIVCYLRPEGSHHWAGVESKGSNQREHLNTKPLRGKLVLRRKRIAFWSHDQAAQLGKRLKTIVMKKVCVSLEILFVYKFYVRIPVLARVSYSAYLLEWDSCDQIESKEFDWVPPSLFKRK